MDPSTLLAGTTPMFCPNQNCEHHAVTDPDKTLPKNLAPKNPVSDKTARWFWRFGKRRTTAANARLQRFKCKSCGRSFTQTYYTLEYRLKKHCLHEPVFSYSNDNLTNRQISRRLSIAEATVRLRLQQLARCAMLKHTQLTATFTITEPLVYDGLENFAQSQYDPNNINHVIGRESYFMYDFGFSPLNRKGRKSDRQKKIEGNLEEHYGRYPVDAVYTNTRDVFKRVFAKCRPSAGSPIELLSDQHYLYRRVLAREFRHIPIRHHQTSSLDTRTYKNNLFPVNHADMLVRHHSSAFRRETIAFSKNHLAMIDRYLLFMTFKNYFRPQFVKPHKRNPGANTNSPAMAAGVVDKIFSFKEFFSQRISKLHVSLSKEWSGYYTKTNTYERMRRVAAYAGI